jgi:hypothetical protein
MSKATRTAGYLRTAILIMALALPAGSLMVVGTLWLWENGFILQWTLGAGLVALAVYGLGHSFLKEAGANRYRLREQLRRSDPLWTEREAEAWDVVRTIAEDVDPERLNSRKPLASARARSRRLANPCWRGQSGGSRARAPGARQARQRRAPVVRENIIRRHLTIGQASDHHQWRSVIGVTEAAYDAFSIQKHLPPSRGRKSKRHGGFDRERNEPPHSPGLCAEVAAPPFTLQRTPASLARDPAAGCHESGKTARRPRRKAKALRIPVGGQVAAGKSSLAAASCGGQRLPTRCRQAWRACELARRAWRSIVDRQSCIEANEVAIESLKTQANTIC